MLDSAIGYSKDGDAELFGQPNKKNAIQRQGIQKVYICGTFKEEVITRIHTQIQQTNLCLSHQKNVIQK